MMPKNSPDQVTAGCVSFRRRHSVSAYSSNGPFTIGMPPVTITFPRQITVSTVRSSRTAQCLHRVLGLRAPLRSSSLRTLAGFVVTIGLVNWS